MERSENDLLEVRKRIDDIDEGLHDLLIERAALVQAVIDAKADSATPFFRPGREADILRRLVERHEGSFPLVPLVLIWRQIISASLGLQSRFVVSVCAAEETDARRELAQAHFGVAAPISVHGTAAGVFNAVTHGRASVGILPFPADGEDEPWWPRLVRYSEGPDGGPSIVARLPFAPTGRRPDAAADSLLIAMQAPEPSARDRSVIAVETDTDTSRTRVQAAFRSHGLEIRMTMVHRGDANPETELFLLEVDGFIRSDDNRVAEIEREIGGQKPVAVQVLGAYAEPFPFGDFDARHGANEP